MLIYNKACSRAFTLVEMMTVIVIVGILMVAFYNVLLLNNSALDFYSLRTDLWQDIDRIVDRITDDARVAQQIQILNAQSVSFLNTAGAVIVNYTILPNGFCNRTQSGVVTTLSTFLDFNNSSFISPDGASLRINLTLRGRSLAGEVAESTSTEVFARNH